MPPWRQDPPCCFVRRADEPNFLAGYTDAVYEHALGVELATRQISHEDQVPVTVAYRRVEVGRARLDLLIGRRLVVEIKAVEQRTASPPL